MEFSIVAQGKYESLEKLKDILECRYDYEKRTFSYNRHFFGIEEVSIRLNNNKLHAVGKCQSSAEECFLNGIGSFYQEAQMLYPKDLIHATTIDRESKLLGLDIQLNDNESSFHFKPDCIFLIVGASGSGKTVLTEGLQKKGYKSIESYTDRPPRHDGERGHTFISPEEMDDIKDSSVAYTEYNGYRYCATPKQVNEADVYVIDPRGIDFFKERYKGRKIPVVVFIDVPENVRLERMLHRGDKPEQARQRIENDKTDFKDVTYDYIIDGNKPCEVVEQEVLNLLGGVK